MGRYNGTFNYTSIQSTQEDPDTGFYSTSETSASAWAKGCECQIERSIPARQIIGADGQMYAYTYDVFIPRHFRGELAIGARMQVVSEDGVIDEFTIQGVDSLNRKYIEVWG